MTLVQKRQCTTGGPATAAGPQVRDDMTVEVALSVMSGAGTGHLFLCDADDTRTGLVTRAQLATVRDSAHYTDLVRLRDVLAGTPRTAPVPCA